MDDHPPAVAATSRFWFITFTTYGTWLPGDSRGSVSNVYADDGSIIRHNHRTEPYDAGDADRRNAADRHRRHPVVRLSPAQAIAVLDQFHETARLKMWVLHAASVASNHAHLLVEVDGDPDPHRVRATFKSYAARRLNRLFGPCEEWWTDKGSVRKKPDPPSVYRCVAYVRDQPDAFVTYLSETSEWVRWLPIFESEHSSGPSKSTPPASPERE